MLQQLFFTLFVTVAYATGATVSSTCLADLHVDERKSTHTHTRAHAHNQHTTAKFACIF